MREKRAAIRSLCFSMPTLAEAQAALNQGDWTIALAAFEALGPSERATLNAKYGKATAQMELGFLEEAGRAFAKMHRAHPKNMSILFMRGKTKIMSGQTDDGLKDIETVWRTKPSVLALRLRAGVKWMRGDLEGFHACLKSAAAIPDFVPVVADIQREAGFLSDALITIGAAKPGIDKDAIEAHIHLDLGDGMSAEQAAIRALKQQPGYPPALSHYIVALLMSGKAPTALQAIQHAKRADPLGQRWIADEIVALRLANDPRCRQLANLDQFVRAFRLPVPEGFSTIEAFNAALQSAVEKYQYYSAHPIGQSLRSGIQTSVELSQLDDPVIRAYFNALDGPIREFLSDIGSDKSHPLTARNTGNYRIAGSWSVTLHGGGNHVNHFHPEGWISSSYYVSVPPETEDETRRAGWIKFAEPPYQTQPPSPPLKWIKPEAGMLVLFPSYLWHGTEPIDEGSTRITAPFDIVPA